MSAYDMANIACVTLLRGRGWDSAEKPRIRLSLHCRLVGGPAEKAYGRPDAVQAPVEQFDAGREAGAYTRPLFSST